MSSPKHIPHKRHLPQRLPAGYTVRPAQPDDAPHAVALFNVCSMRLVGEAPNSESELRVEWSAPKFDLSRDTRVILSPRGDVVGYAELWDTADPHVVAYAWGRVHPDHEGRGIGSFLMAWEKQRARQAIDKAPPDARVIVRTGALDRDLASTTLFKDHGFTPIRQFLRMMIQMTKTPPAPSWPSGVTVRTFARSDLEATARAVRDSFSDHWGHVDTPFDQDLEEWRHWIDTDEQFDPSVWYLAESEGELVGVALCTPKRHEDPSLGWIHTLGVRRTWRRRGIALALLRHALSDLYTKGKPKVGLDVDAESLTGATRLYERAGMRCERRSLTYEKELRAGIDLTCKTLEPSEGLPTP
jgi:mycothiol synthase